MLILVCIISLYIGTGLSSYRHSSRSCSCWTFNPSPRSSCQPSAAINEFGSLAACADRRLTLPGYAHTLPFWICDFFSILISIFRRRVRGARRIFSRLTTTPRRIVHNLRPPDRGGGTCYHPLPLRLNNIYTKLKPGDDREPSPPA